MSGAKSLYPHVTGKLFGKGYAMLRQFTRPKGSPVGRAADAFAVGRAEIEEDGELAFGDGGMLFEREAVFQLYLRFR